MLYVAEDTEHCPVCSHFTVVRGGSADGGDVAAYTLCAQCKDHHERLAHFDQDVTREELEALVAKAF